MLDDAHAKSLATIFTDRGPRLAPFYDLICTQVYPDLSEKQAMGIGGENRPSWIQRRHCNQARICLKDPAGDGRVGRAVSE